MGIIGEILFLIFTFGLKLITGTVSYVYVHAFPADGWNLFWVALFVVLLMMIVTGAVWLYMSINFLAFIVYPLVLLLFGFVLVFLAGYALYLGVKYMLEKYKAKGVDTV